MILGANISPLHTSTNWYVTNMASDDAPKSATVTRSRSKDSASYVKEPGEKLGVLARDLLENYSGIPPEEVAAHVKKIVMIPCSPQAFHATDKLSVNSEMRPGKSFPTLASEDFDF